MKTKLFLLFVLFASAHCHGMDCCGKLGRGIKDIVQVVTMGDDDIKRLPKDQAEVIERCELGCFGCGLLCSYGLIMATPHFEIKASPEHLVSISVPLVLGVCCGRIGGATVLAYKRKQD